MLLDVCLEVDNGLWQCVVRVPCGMNELNTFLSIFFQNWNMSSKVGGLLKKSKLSADQVKTHMCMYQAYT